MWAAPSNRLGPGRNRNGRRESQAAGANCILPEQVCLLLADVVCGHQIPDPSAFHCELIPATPQVSCLLN
jgi:hypothetical protein